MTQKLFIMLKKLAKELKLFAPTCIQCIKNEKELKFLEINTRLEGIYFIL